MRATISLAAFLCAYLAGRVDAHEHHDDKIPDGQAVSPDPLDSILWIHIIIQTVAFGLIFPTGVVLGIVRSRWHVPVQVVGSVLAVLGWFLGHAHKGRQFARNIHASFASSLMLMLIIQVGLGIYLKLHLEKGIHGRIRRSVVFGHGIIGKVMPVVSWVQMLFGGITALGFCRADHLGQCLAHFIMGSAFIGYGILLTILLLVGQAWLRRTGRSQEFFDSLIITAWGCVNTFTEHRWGGPWVHNDLQHTTMGIVWWCAGLLGLWLSRTRDGRPKRNLIPGIVILLTGYAMSAHPQNLPLSTMVHSVFGYTLMAAGATRIIEIAFVLRDRNSLSDDGADANSFQHLPPFLLYASGLLFMGATEEQMDLADRAGFTHVAYVLILYSVAFLMYLFVNILLHLYTFYAWPASTAQNPSNRPGQSPYIHSHRQKSSSHRINGNANGSLRRASEAQLAQDAEAFELEGLMSDGEGEDKDQETPKASQGRTAR